MKFPGFAGPSEQMVSPAASQARSVNLYPIPLTHGRMGLRSTPGTQLFTTLPTGPVRGFWANESTMYAVGGATLYQVSSGGVATSRGVIGTDLTNSPVLMEANIAGTQLVIVSAGQAFVDNGAGPSSAPVPPDDSISSGLPGGQTGTATSIASIDGYFIATKLQSKRFMLSALNNGGSWDVLDFGQKSIYPDNIVRCYRHHNDLWLMGSETIEIWRNNGNPDFPFALDKSATIEQGLWAFSSVCQLGNGLAWLGSTKRGKFAAYQAQGYTTVRISTPAVETIWSNYLGSDAIAYSYTAFGGEFWVVSFPSALATWVYDATTRFWHERAYWNSSSFEHARERCHVYAYDRHLVGDRVNGNIYEMSPLLGTENGQVVRRIRQAPFLQDDRRLIRHYSFGLDADPRGQFSNALLDWTDDDGTTWSTARLPTVVSALSKQPSHVEWRRLGSSRRRLYRGTFQSSLPITILDAFLNLDGEE